MCRGGLPAYGRRLSGGDTIGGDLILCPACGADKLIPLTFPVYRREAGPEIQIRRPMAKCSCCGERMYAHVVARSRLAVEEPDTT
jgi:hypothetical protein